ncbi:MAG: Maf family protein [Sphingomonadaceae bacterium]
MIILASKSESRQAMLRAAKVDFKPVPASVDERLIELSLEDKRPQSVALALSEAKAMAVSAGITGTYVLGSDSLIVADGQRFDKPESREQAAEHLRFFSGKVMELHSAAALVRDGDLIWHHADCAKLHVRKMSEDFIRYYLDMEWPAVRHCVGVFRIEAAGVQLFDRVEGDHFTILGMPLLPVLAALRTYGELPG